MIDAVQQSEYMCCWLSLDELDRDPLRFLSYLLASISEEPVQVWVGRGLSVVQVSMACRPSAMSSSSGCTSCGTVGSDSW